MRVALLFIDGVGVGRRDPEHNPLARVGHLLSHFTDAPSPALPGGGRFVSVDPTFGISGRPQSASNQTALLTALPAPRLVGRHVLGYPDASLRELLAGHSLVRTLTGRGQRATFANSYPAAYLHALGLAAATAPHAGRAPIPEVLRLTAAQQRRLRASATTLAFAAGSVPLRTLSHARADGGLTHDILGDRARARGLDVPLRTPEEAADLFVALAAGIDFTLFEHYLADEAGHAQDLPAALSVLGTFDRFLRRVIARRPPDLTVLVCSDHGNVEDLSIRQHTLNRVPVLGFGPGAAHLGGLETIADVGALILRQLDAAAPRAPG